MKFTWFGHSGFRIEIGDQVLLLDPWLTNPLFPSEARGPAIAGATHILLTHGHFDHSDGVVDLAKACDVPVVGIYDLVSYWESSAGIATVGFNMGGTVMLGDVAVSMVHATHSSSIATDHGPMYAGTACGYVLSHGGRAVYISGDTDVTMDMDLIQALHEPEIGILACGGHFTPNMARMAYGAKRFFRFKTIIPCHYRTFPLLEQSAAEMIAALPEVSVIEPQVMEPIAL